jgi:hypothetical protein
MDGCFAKIARADEHINNLGPELDTFVAANYHAYRVVPEFNRESGEYTITAFDDGGINHPLRFSVIIGEVVHQLRSSLDHVIWALASVRHTNPPARIGFPICESPKAFERAMKQGMLSGITVKARTIVDSLQPYRHVQPRRSFLFRLHHLSNTEKHRLLIVTCGLIANPSLDVDPGSRDLTIVLPPPETATFKRPSKQGTQVLKLTSATSLRKPK